ncbi:MAG: rod shape-determining protein MreD [Parafannyhessea sp.]|uniref:rod shape-determining protein MreD n=1 Tax=Parafannyhessea sp. TaxID=2847324 RepID=UPI003EFF1ECA
MQVKDTNKNKRSIGWLALVCLVLQLAVAPNLALGNGRINFALIFSAVVALTIGGRTGVACGFLSGLVFDLSTTGPVGLMALLLTISSFQMGMECRNRLAGEVGPSMMLFAIHAVLVSLFYHVAMLIVGQASSIFDVIVQRTLPTLLLTVIAFIPFAIIYSRGEGTGLGGRQRGSHSKKGQKYNIGNI